MAGNETHGPRRATLLALAALAALAYVTTRQDDESAVSIPPGAVAWHGAMSLYRNVALWAGKRAMSAEMNYWKAVG
jgi:hypothetical protein